MSLLHILHPWRKIKCYKAVALCLSFVLLWGLDMGNDGVGWWHCTSRYSALRGSPQEKRGKKGCLRAIWGFSILLGLAVHDLPTAQTRSALVWWIGDISATRHRLLQVPIGLGSWSYGAGAVLHRVLLHLPTRGFLHTN